MPLLDLIRIYTKQIKGVSAQPEACEKVTLVDMQTFRQNKKTRGSGFENGIHCISLVVEFKCEKMPEYKQTNALSR